MDFGWLNTTLQSLRWMKATGVDEALSVEYTSIPLNTKSRLAQQQFGIFVLDPCQHQNQLMSSQYRSLLCDNQNSGWYPFPE